MSQYYKKYMKKREEEEKPGYLKLFVGAFLVMIVFFIIMATHLTLGIDTNIGENDEGDIKESGLGVKHLIDSRLRFIQMDDRSGGVNKDNKESSDIDKYGKTIKDEAEKGYSGQYQDSYGYDSTQHTKPYSQTYTNTKPETHTTQPAKPVPTPVSVSVPITAPTPAKPKPSTTPSHNIQKNLTPTGMN